MERSRSRLRLYCCVSAVIGLFCRQYDIIKDNDSNNNPKEKGKGPEQSPQGRPVGTRQVMWGLSEGGKGDFASRSSHGKGEGQGGAGKEGEWIFGMEKATTLPQLETQAIFFYRKSPHPSTPSMYE